MKRDEYKRFAKRLESERPQPGDEFVSSVANRLRANPHPRASGWRLAIAAAFTMLLVLAFALTGGIGYAASTVKSGTSAVTSLVVGSSKADTGDNAITTNTAGNQVSSARNQYQEKVVLCHHPPSPKNPHTVSVPANAVPDHLAHGDTLGPCPSAS